MEPANPRDSSRCMVINKHTAQLSHTRFNLLPDFLTRNDLLVINRTRVLPARLKATGCNGRTYEILLTRPQRSSPSRWDCLVKPGKKICGSTQVTIGKQTAIIERSQQGFQITFPLLADEHCNQWLEETGTMPLPPYIRRPILPSDRDNYQTVYAKIPGSVAAPTAGLHFTQSLVGEMQAKGISFADLILHVGYGTFAPIRSENLDEHVMHEEFYEIPQATMERIQKTREIGGRVIAVGTTTLRALESIPIQGLSGATRLFIRPGHSFNFADGLITNFHLPRSSLLILVCAFLGKETTLQCYREAVSNKYRFFSYGDAMAIL